MGNEDQPTYQELVSLNKRYLYLMKLSREQINNDIFGVYGPKSVENARDIAWELECELKKAAVVIET